MEGEDIRYGTRKKRSKKETGFDSDDDEPIGSIVKVKRSKRKGSGGGEAVREKEDLGGMDDNDTLASFRKRLKGPKRDRGSEFGRGTSPNFFYKSLKLESHEMFWGHKDLGLKSECIVCGSRDVVKESLAAFEAS